MKKKSLLRSTKNVFTKVVAATLAVATIVSSVPVKANANSNAYAATTETTKAISEVYFTEDQYKNGMEQLLLVMV